MKNNRDILNEAFFKKSNYYDKLVKSLPQYSPVDPKNVGAFQVSDTDEVKKRLAQAYGVIFGKNNIKTMANKAIKEFPIIVSDAVEPDTIIMLKKLMEEQYAEYISLLVSNKVIDLSSYYGGNEDGNIAIQAIDDISGSDFSKSRLGNKAITGNITTDDLFKNIPLYNILKENRLQLTTNEPIFDTLFENAIVVPNENVKDVVELLEDATTQYVDGPTFRKDLENNQQHREEKNTYNGDVKSQLASLNVIVDANKFDNVMDITVREFLLEPNNSYLYDKFKKAVFLLQSSLITGKEFSDYLIFRLGVPVSDKVKRELATKFKKIYYPYNDDFKLDEETLKRINHNERVVDPLVKEISNAKVGSALKASLAGSAIGGAASGVLGAGLTAAGVIGSLGLLPFAALGLAVGGTVGFIMHKVAKKREEILNRKLDNINNKIVGWERVEALIKRMEEARDDLKNPKAPVSYNPNIANPNVRKSISIEDNLKSFDEVSNITYKRIDSLLRESTIEDLNTEEIFEPYELSEETIEESARLWEDVVNEEINKSDELKKEILIEKKLGKLTKLDNGKQVEVKYIEKKPGADVLLSPTYLGTRTNYGYGETEINRRDNRDRRYNQPLVMTVRFKERYSDGKFADNELTAVIGILGKVIRVPSEEMEYILKENASGNTVEGLFDIKNIKNMVSDMFTNKISKELKALPQSADIWHNLEKISTLAIANKISGKRNNNIANAHIIFSQKEIDDVRTDLGVDYLRDVKKTVALMKRYSAFTIMVANDPGQRAYIFDDQDAISWNVVPYSAMVGKESGEQLNAALAKLSSRL